MKITPIRFVRNVELSKRFYSTLGLIENEAATSGTWAELHGSGGHLGLHIAQPDMNGAGAVALQFSSDESLNITAQRLSDAGYTPSDIIDETFGRFFTVMDPDGCLLQINELDEDLRNRSYEIRESSALK